MNSSLLSKITPFVWSDRVKKLPIGDTWVLPGQHMYFDYDNYREVYEHLKSVLEVIVKYGLRELT